MTSKEALEEIIDYIKHERNDEHIPFFVKCYINDINKDLDRLKKIEKELKQTKSNFKNSQTHSKKCYKKLKNDMNRLIKIIKDYSLITNYDMAWGVNVEDEEFLRKILK